MRYAPFAHEAALGRLSEALPQRRLFFALWCQEALWVRGGEFLLSRLSPTDRNALLTAREAMWIETFGGPSANAMPEISRVVGGFEVDPDDYWGAARCASDLSGLMVETARADDLTATAVQSGMLVLDHLYDFLQERFDAESCMTSPVLLAEVSRQLVMIDSLLVGPPSAEMRSAGRPSSLFSWD